MLRRRAKAYSSSCLQTISLSSPISSQFILGVCAAAEDHKKINKNPLFWKFRVIYVNTTKMLITSACCDRQHAHAYLQLFSRKTGQPW